MLSKLFVSGTERGVRNDRRRFSRSRISATRSPVSQGFLIGVVVVAVLVIVPEIIHTGGRQHGAAKDSRQAEAIDRITP